MATLNGRNARITVSSDTTEAIVTEIGNFDIDRSAEDIDTTSFGDGWGKSDVGMKKWSGSMSGFFDPADTTGQGVLETAFEDGTLIPDIRFYLKYSTTSGDSVTYIVPDTDTDANAGARITSLRVGQDKSGVASFSASFTGSGPAKIVTEPVT